MNSVLSAPKGPAQQESESIRSIVSKVRPLLTATPRRVAALVFSYSISGFLEAFVLVLLVQIASAIAAHQSTVGFDAGPTGSHTVPVPVLFGVLLAAVVVSLMVKGIAAWLAPKMSEEALVSLRLRGVASFLNANWSTEAAERHGHFQSTVGLEVNKVGQLIQFASQAIGQVITIAAFLATAVVVSAVAAAAIVASLVVLYTALRPVSRIAQRWSRRAAISQKEVGSVLHNVVENAQEIMVFGVGDAVTEQASEIVEKNALELRRNVTMTQIVPPLYQAVALVLVTVGLISIYEFGGESLVSLAAIILLLYRALAYGQGLQGAYANIRSMLPSIDQIEGDINRWQMNQDRFGDESIGQLESIRLTDVAYSYDGNRVALSAVSVDVKAGESIGIVGPSGAGKSTFVQILLRLRTPTKGEFFFNETPVRGISALDWNRLVACLPQDPHLIEASVEENIRFYRPGVSRNDIIEAARRAQLHDEILEWDAGYARRIDPREQALSGGQRQRLCLARALATNPSVLVLDEPTSALDLRSEEAIHDTLRDMKGSTTLFIVAHRPSTLKFCDRLMVFESGSLKAFEKPTDLRLTSEFYREITTLSSQNDSNLRGGEK